MASFVAEQKLVMIVTSEGKIAADTQPLCRLNVTVIAEDGAQRQMGSFGGGGRVEWRYFLEGEKWRDYAKEAARQAIVNLDAVDAPAGERVVVLAPDGRESCCMKQSATGSKATSIARAPRHSREKSASASPANSAPWSMTARSRTAAAASTSMTKARRPRAPC